MFWKQITARTLILITNQLSIIFVTLYLANILGLELFGVYASAVIIIQIIGFFVDGGFFIPASKELGLNSKYSLQKKVLFEIYTCKLIIFCCLAFIIILLNKYTLNLFDTKLIVSILIAGLFYGFYPLWFFQVRNEVNRLVLVNLISRIIYICLILSFVINYELIYLAILAQALAYFIPLIFAIIKFRDILRVKIFLSNLNFKHRLVQSIPFFIGNNLLNQSHNFWGIILVLFSSTTQVGIFQIADSCLRTGMAFTQALSDNLLLRHQKIGKLDKNIYLNLILLLIFLVILSLGIYKPLINNFMIIEYSLTLPVIKITIFSWFVLSIISLLNYPTLGVFISYKNANVFFIYFLIIQLSFLCLFVFNNYSSALQIELFFLSSAAVSLLILLLIIYREIKYKN